MHNRFQTKKSFILLLYVSVISVVGAAQTPRPVPTDYAPGTLRSYVRVWDATAPEQSPATLMTRPLKDVKQTTQYVDGLGRPLQTVVKQGSYPTGGSAVDMVDMVEYDAFGREQFKYLPTPATTSDGIFKLNPFSQQASFYANTNVASPIYNQGEDFFYSQTVYEPSPLNRISETAAAGDNWTGTMYQTTEASRRSVKTKYFVNTTVDDVRIWNVTVGALGSFSTYATPGAYASGLLTKTIIVDEHGKQVIEFKDKDGKIILKKVQIATTAGTEDDGTGRDHPGWLCTYYLYDDLNNLRCVIQPRGVELLDAANWAAVTLTSILPEQCFRYEYDQRNRMIIKKVPGADQVDMVYDARDRLVMMQDGKLKLTNQWLVTKYDLLNRPIETGLWTNTTAVATHRTNAALSTSYPTTSGTYDELTRTYYDNYDWVAANGNMFTVTRNTQHDSHFLPASNTVYPYPQPLTQSFNTKGMVTGTRTKVLGTSQYLWGIIYYDDKGREIQRESFNITNSMDHVVTQYDFSGKVLRQFTAGWRTLTVPRIDCILTVFDYDDLGRVTTIKKTPWSYVNSTWYGGVEQDLVKNEYDALGQLKKKKVGNKPGAAAGTPLANLENDYNIRGWLLSINKNYITAASNSDQYFGMELGYDKNASFGTFTSQYNGNIGGTIWKTEGDQQKRKYDFTYDAANRLTKAGFTQYVTGSGAAATFNTSAGIDFSIGGDPATGGAMKYDANGNILEMWQTGLKLNASSVIDKLAYTYNTNSNKLLKVFDAVTPTTENGKLGDFKDGTNGTGNDYTYDVNGNLTADNNKAISSITYNHLNLPEVITITGKGTITYTYDAAGNKLKKVTQENGATVSYNGTNYTGINITTTVTYLGGSVFEAKAYTNNTTLNTALGYTDRLQFIGHEEGRIRWKNENNTFNYDYFIKDYLGNVRMVLTEEQQTDAYPAATLEPATITSESTYYGNLSNTQFTKPAWFSDPLFTTNTKVAQVKNATGIQKIGPNIVLKVMAGDTYNIRVASGWSGTTATNSSPNVLADLLSLLSGGIANLSGGKVTQADLQAAGSGLNTGLSNFMAGQTTSGTKPKAYISWILLDEQFRVAKDASGNIIVSGYSGFEQVGASGSSTIHTKSNLTVAKNGYLYIYTSNEATDIDVFFDNLQVTHIRGRILEETHYYPFGLTMAGISSKALAFGKENKFKYNGYEENKSFDLNLYESFFRTHDPQVGRFWQTDPKPYESVSPYAAMLNNPLLYNDLLGDTAKIGTITPNQVGTRTKADITQQLVNEWSKLTGLKLSLDADGNLVNGGVATNKGISKTARKDILEMIKSDGTVYVDFTTVTASRTSNATDGSKNSFITMNVDRIDAQVAGTSKDLNKMTAGMGMSVLHEMGHTFLNGNLPHSNAEMTQFGVIGPIDQKMNQIRREMGMKNWGQRLSYTYLNVNGYNYTPMNSASLKAMQNVLPAIMSGNTQNIPMPSTGVIKQKSSIMGQALGYE